MKDPSQIKAVWGLVHAMSLSTNNHNFKSELRPSDHIFSYIIVVMIWNLNPGEY